MSRLRLIRIYLVIGCFCSVLLMLVYYFVIGYRYWCSEKLEDATVYREQYFSLWQRDQAGQKRKHPILIYQPKSMEPNMQAGFAVFRSCPVSNCIITSLESHIETADVIFFAESSEWLPPVVRNPAQLWIIRLLENPMNTVSLTAYNRMVNYTASYRPDSNILAPYGVYRKYNKNDTSHTHTTFQGYEQRNGIAWFVSNCFTGNNRMGYVRELKKYYKVDVYGKCGTSTVNKKEEKKVLNNYKYYLAFENSNCRHYITEKFWQNSLGNGLIPIVMGPPKKDYQLVAPPGSFIHVDDFKSPEDLARYLDQIDSNQELYLSYFYWEREGNVMDSNFYCRLCAFVQSPPVSTYNNLDAFWRVPGQCTFTNHTKLLTVL